MNKPVTQNEIMAQANRQPVASQATTIEQSRAVAEVQARVLVAQRCPRNSVSALEKAIESCKQMAVAQTAFYKFPRGGETVSGESISLAVELARCWGNIDYGIMELARGERETEMLAFAWDLETNTVSRQTFIVPHTRDTRSGPKALTDTRDIYENNANNGARRLRECIFRVLPPHLKEAAKATCYATLEKGEGEKPLTVRVTEAIGAFKNVGIALDRLEKKFGPSGNWTPTDIAQLEVSFRSIKRREVSPDEEFPRNDTAEINDHARALADQRTSESEPEQGRTDEQHGDQHDGSEDEAPVYQPMVDDWKGRIERVELIADLNTIRSEFREQADFLPDDVTAEIEGLLTGAATRLTTKGN